MTFSAILTALGLKPKNLEEARAAMEPAKATLDSVNALFTAAGLNLEQLLAAGPDALKAHLASLDQSEEIKSLNQKFTALEAEAKTLTEKGAAQLKEVEALAGTVKHFATAIGVPLSATTPTADYVALFDKHVAKQTTLALAKTGHPPAHVPPATETTTAAQTDEQILAEYEKLSAAGDATARTAFFDEHDAAIKRAVAARAKAAR